MYFLPAFTVGEHVMRRVDLLGDVRTQKDIAEEPDSLLPPPPKVKPAFVDTCRAGMTCIEDYSDSTLRGMTPFTGLWMNWHSVPVRYVLPFSEIPSLKRIFLLRICVICCRINMVVAE